MSGRREPKQKIFAALFALAVLGAFSSCASSSPDGAKAGDAASSDAAALLDDSKPQATDVSDGSAFSDLEKDGKKDASSGAAAADGDIYYKSYGGETLRHVAFTLYSNKAFSKQLLEKNPDLKDVQKLSADQKVFFDMDSVRPEPRYLTKDLLDRYSQPLAERLQAEEKGLPTTTVTLAKGETLQDLSQRLYGTHRYWTEIYLANRDKIQNYDRVPAGLTVSVVSRQGVAKAEAPAAAAVLAEVQETPPPVMAAPVAVVPTQAVIQPPPAPAPVVKETPKDPIPEIPPIAEKAPPPPMRVEPPKAKPVPVSLDSSEGSTNSSLRRILYVALIVLLGGAAFYFTRTPKRPKVDMLDLNADAGARPKFPPKDSQKSHIS